MDRLASINAFVRVAESGGFAAAARRLNLSKATVTNQIQALENALGARLLNRTTRRVRLTEIGRSYYERCVQILHDLEEADETAGAQQATPRGQLRVHCQQGIVQFVTPVVIDFLARYPEASVDLRSGHAMIDMVEEGFDLAISPFLPSDATIVRRRLATFRLVLSAAPAYLERHPAPQSPADLAGHNCLHYPYAPGFAEGWHFLDASGNPVVARKSDQQQPRYSACRRGSRHRPGVDGAIHGRRFACLRSAGAAAAQLSNAGV